MLILLKITLEKEENNVTEMPVFFSYSTQNIK